jgi:hypothetical protein
MSICARRLGAMQVYTKVVSISNKVTSTVEASIRPGSSDRYSVHPASLKLKPGQSADVELRLKVVRFAQVDKAVQFGHRDTFHIKTPYSDQKFQATFFLSSDCLGGDLGGRTAPSLAVAADIPTVQRSRVLAAQLAKGAPSAQYGDAGPQVAAATQGAGSEMATHRFTGQVRVAASCAIVYV